MDLEADGIDGQIPSLSGRLAPDDVNMDLTMCGLLVDQAEELATLYREHGNWNDVKEVWFEERRSNRSTRGSAQKIFRVLTSRFKNAPAALPKPSRLPQILNRCETPRDKAQVLYLYLVADDSLVRYAVHEYIIQLHTASDKQLNFENQTICELLSALKFTDGSAFDYAESTTQRWCEGFRSVMREIDVIDSQRSVVGSPPSIGTVPLLVATGYSYEEGDDDWLTAPIGLLYLFQPKARWEELYDRIASTNAWETIELHGELQFQPANGVYDWATSGGEI